MPYFSRAGTTFPLIKRPDALSNLGEQTLLSTQAQAGTNAHSGASLDALRPPEQTGLVRVEAS